MTDRTRPLVSVILCVRNGAPTLLAQLRALGGQVRAPEFEVVVVDNGSTDATADVARSWIRDGIGAASAARIIDAADRIGICHARNTGAGAAHGDILAFCDADDVVSAGWLAAACAGLARGHSAITGRIYALEADGAPSDRVILDEPGRVVTAFASVPFAWGCSFAVTADAFATVGGFDESLPPYGCDDTEIGLRLAAAGITVAYEPEMVIHYREPTATRALTQRSYRGGVAQACLWERHPDVYGPLPRLGQQVRAVTVDPLRTLLKGSGAPRERADAARTQLAHNTGTVIGVHRWVRSGRLGEPRLFSDGRQRGAPA